LISYRGFLIRLIIKHWFGPKFNRLRAIDEQRIWFAKITRFQLLPRGILVENVQIEGIDAEWIRPRGAAEKQAILYLHGGGYMTGSYATHRNISAHIACASGRNVLSINYRLAPEHPFPAALEDAQNVYLRLLRKKYSPVAIAGDSAGGGLALGTQLALRDSGDTLPAVSICLSPWTDLKLTGDSLISNAAIDPFLKNTTLKFSATSYRHDHDPALPLISPLYGDFRGFGPMLIQVGRDEILLSDSERLATRAKEDGVNITFETWDHMWHGWHIFAGLLPEADQAINSIGEFIKLHAKSTAL